MVKSSLICTHQVATIFALLIMQDGSINIVGEILHGGDVWDELELGSFCRFD